MNRIDKFVYINLDKRSDRNQHLLNELKRFNIPEEKIIRVSAVESPKGAYGCALSHMRAMEMFRNSDDEVWCILEDDHYFTQTYEDTEKILNEFFDKPEYDVFLGSYCAVKGRDLLGTSFRRTIKSCMCSFYVVHRRVCEALLASHKQSSRTLSPSFGRSSGIPCDMMWNHVMSIFWFVAPYKPYGGQILNYSNIRNRVMDYSTYIGMKIDRELEKWF